MTPQRFPYAPPARTLRLSSLRLVQSVSRGFAAAAVVAGLGVSLGCAATPACRRGATGDVAMAGRTAGEAVETGAKTGVEGVKTAGRAAGGYIEGGSKEGKEEWNKGKAETKETAHEGAAETKKEASVPVCKD
jgi:hypothetical protein